MPDLIYRGFGGYRLFTLAADGTFNEDSPLYFGKILNDTVKSPPPSPTENDIFEEGDNVNPVISDSFPGARTVTMTLLYQDPKMRELLMRETLTTVDGRVVASDFGDYEPVHLGLELENRKGFLRRYNRVKVTALDDDNYNENGFMGVQVTFKVMKPLNESLPIKETVYPVGVTLPNGSGDGEG